MLKAAACLLILSLCPLKALADISIVTTIRPLEFIATAILGNQGSVTSVIDQQDSPHHYIVSPSDRINLGSADLLIWVGPEFEHFLADFFQSQRTGTEIIDVLNIPVLTVHSLQSGQVDPHFWLDTTNALHVAEQVAERLAIIDPGHAAEFQLNLQAFSLRMASLNEQVSELLKNPDKDDYIVYHDAYQYFEQQFGLRHGMALLEDPEVEPGMRDILSRRESLAELNPGCILMEQDSNQDLVATMLGELRPREFVIDLLGYQVESGEEAYSRLIAKVADQFASCVYPDASI